MKLRLITFFAAIFMVAQSATAQMPYPKVTTPTDVRVLVYQATAGACQIVEAYLVPCGQHVTVMMFPHNPETIVYKVTMTYTQYPSNGDVKVWSKQVLDIDHQGMISVTFLIGPIEISDVKIEKATTSSPAPAFREQLKERRNM